MNFKIHKKTAGETLIEVIVSLTVIMISGAAAVIIVMTALETTVMSENYLVAQNLSEEALEAVKNLRDTNHMRYPLYKDECWLVLNPATSACDQAVQPELLGGNKYYVVSETTITGTTSTLDLEDGVAAGDENFQVTFANQTDPSKYYRQLEVTEAGTNSVTITVTVEWLDGADVGRFISQPTKIKNEE